ncbi:DUF1015 family protein [Serpentinicella sp. ANB-PHB4]|uniref:DUF1015 domain-containing protein n=1 Tax=Serpentinicella sp. ANB-PHB4 TaxID=3074076 RepID=UPI0028594BE7|nr:DUF1015 family protein [Serpentinicella sp. ANB-PHB4]MDR5659308.1 DUF1015 family protein [Serpentinicella sp. ANB-PHB4]
MITVKPFKALRPKKELVEKVVSLPYDVMNKEEAKRMAEGNPYSFLRVTRSEIDLEGIDNVYSTEVYEKAKENLERFEKEDILIRDPQQNFYIYRQEMNGKVQTGLVACTSIDDYLEGKIKKHEYTRVEKEIDRINHFDYCDANTEPIFLTYRSDAVIKNVINQWATNHLPEYDLVTDDGIKHILWCLTDQSVIEQIKERFKKVSALYISDGHHRTESAVKVGLKRREANPDFTGEEAFNYFMSVIFPDEDLYIMDYNRAVTDLNGLTEKELIEEIEKQFLVEKSEEKFTPTSRYTYGMYLNEQWYKLTAKEDTYKNKDVIAKLDVSILQDNILSPILGIEDPRTDKRIDFIGGIRGLEELEKRVHTDMTVAFSLYPTTIDDLLTVADQGEVMPPKSTWFEPKLRSGLFVHTLDTE